MENRINIRETEPEAYKGMFALENYLKKSALKEAHYYLIFIRASQINRCAFCIDKHTSDAIESGEDIKRLFLLDAWKESSAFTEEERVILAITEEVTLIQKTGLTDETYLLASKFFDDNYLAQIIMAVVTINAWNRIAISTKMGVEKSALS